MRCAFRTMRLCDALFMRCASYKASYTILQVFSSLVSTLIVGIDLDAQVSHEVYTVNMLYHSTRSESRLVSGKQAILEGISPDGGLYVSDQLLNASMDIAKLCSQDYQATARDVLQLLVPDFTEDEINSCVAGAYGTNFDDAAITPLTPLADEWLPELFHGPTSAFKDVALQMLPQLMSCARPSQSGGIMVVTATSGDTGKAALEGFADVAGTGVTVFYPYGKVSDVQRLQMVTQRGNNLAVCAVEGNFDDAQTEVKAIFADRARAERLAHSNVSLSSANSINIGRLIPQVVYYFDAYAQLVRRKAITLGEKVEFCVPTGNFGDVLAGYYAMLLGLPVAKFIVASNANDVLVDFITHGVYDRRRPFIKTISPSMDILVSSNLERLLYYLSGGDCELVASLMQQLAEQGHYQVPRKLLKKIQDSFSCGCADDEATRTTIRVTWEHERVLLDTHTAVGRYVMSQEPQSHVQRILLSTASPFKFPADVLKALHVSVEGMDGFACMDALSHLSGITPPAQLSDLRTADIVHDGVCKVEDMGSFVEDASLRLLTAQ